jgi:hypothetical protein
MSNTLSSLVSALAPARAERPAARGADLAAPAGARGFREALRSALTPRKPREDDEPRTDAAEDAHSPEKPDAPAAASSETDRAVDAANGPKSRDDDASDEKAKKDDTAPNATGAAQAQTQSQQAAASASASAKGGSAGKPTADAAARSATAARAAAAAAAAATQGDPTRPDQALGDLDPEFRARLDRVIERMEALGHTVEVVETARTSERQDYLFAQGRTRPGPVVTWTRDSNHERGLAADLVIDGKYDNAAGFAQLAQVARAEGLHTLGARDPGHVEMVGGGGRGFPGVTVAQLGLPAAMPTEPVQAPQGAGVAQVASVARVADVAQVAQVAEVAPVAQVAQVASVAQVAQVATVATPGAGAAEAGAGAVAPATPARERSKGEERKGDGQPAPDQRQMGHLAADIAGAPRAAAAPRAEATAPPIGAAALDRLTRVLDLQDSAAGRPITQMLLRVENASGGTDSIRVGLRDGSVGASIGLDSRLGADMPGRVEDLQRALQKHGLELDTVQIRSTRNDGAESARVASLLSDVESIKTFNTRGSSDSSTQRDRQGSAQRDLPDSRSDTPRQRSRKEQKGGKNA